ncbi:MAG: carboxypeptidase regulatory-like domain-containing protein [Rubrivivax sp.]|nr:carboxypeptidase regulatory-like domain-containing protein [Pyrinomonadaceae bacterium]
MLTRASLKTSTSKVAALLLLLALSAASPAFAQAPAQREAPATVMGRVTDGEKAVAGITVTLMSGDASMRFRSVARAKTDGEGRYRISNVPPGRYQIMPFAPVYIVQDAGEWPPGKPLMLAAGEEVSDIDFRIERGGVITGRVTDADGKPRIREIVHLSVVNGPNRGGSVNSADRHRYATDDRGVYRIYGLASGQYRVSAGQGKESGRSGPNGFYRQTFYPGTTSEDEAKVVEVTPGGEATDIDITLGKRAKAFKAEGRVVSAENGEHVPGARLGFGTVVRHERRVMWTGTAQSDARGEFHFDAVVPGRYAVFAVSDGATDWYSEAAQFEMKESDIGGLEVRVRRGASLSGIIEVEGTSNRATLARLIPQIFLNAHYDPRAELAAPNFSAPTRPAPDGSFRVGGLRPGRVKIITGWPPVKGLTLLRVEHDGVERSDGIEIKAGAQVTGVRAVFAYGNAAIRGQVNIVGGTLPPQSRLVAFVLRPGGSGHFRGRPAEVDARGRFTVEGLPAGDYELVVQALRPNMPLREIKQQVTLEEDGEMTVSLTLDLNAVNNGGMP